MNAADVMTTSVIVVGPDATVPQVAKILLNHCISAVPVLRESGELLGIVSEGDLMRRPEIDTERRRSWWLDLLTPNETLAAEFAKSHALKITDVMTRHVITAEPATSLGDIAALLEKNAIKRVPIVHDGKVVGIVSRANLLQGLASIRDKTVAATALGDSVIRAKVMARLKAQKWLGPWPLNVIVHDGTVELWGVVDTAAEKKALRVAAEETGGVRAVNDNLMLRPLSLDA